MNKFHILGSVALAFSLFFTLGSAATQAQDGSEFAGGDGTDINPWQIATKKQLAAINNCEGGASGKHFILTKDLKFTAEDFSTFGDFYNDGRFWIPLCDGDNPFQGTFDGNNHTISGIRGTLFGCLAGGTIKNISVNLSSNAEVSAGLLIQIEGGIISNCHVTGDITHKGDNVPEGNSNGGIVAFNKDGGVANIIDSSFKGNVIATDSYYSWCYSGGIIGSARNGKIVISNCFSEGSFVGSHVGVICGAARNITIHGCSGIGNIEGSYKAGGVLGQLIGTGTIIDSYFEGDLIVNARGGGLLGSVDEGNKTLMIKSCYAK